MHKPRYRFDCKRCKFEWNCGPRCACTLKNVDEPPILIRWWVNQARRNANCTIEFKNI